MTMVAYPEKFAEMMRNPKVLVYGQPDTQKSRLILTMPQPVLIGDADDGLLSIARDKCDKQVESIESSEDLRRVLALAESGKFASLVLDDMTTIAKMIYEEELLKAKNNKLRAFGESEMKLMVLVAQVKELPLPVMLVARERSETNEDTAMEEHGPMFIKRSMAGNVVGALNFAFRLSGKPPSLQTKSTAIVNAKDRSNVLADKEPANMAAIIAKLRAEAERGFDDGEE